MVDEIVTNCVKYLQSRSTQRGKFIDASKKIYKTIVIYLEIFFRTKKKSFTNIIKFQLTSHRYTAFSLSCGHTEKNTFTILYAHARRQ